ncbi:hypothetical protein CDIK_3487 [Cucumispora dikerogammari]|nr:hypothetical protein CDIK_3487 [Cucumispora dikerogammari]
MENQEKRDKKESVKKFKEIISIFEDFDPNTNAFFFEVITVKKETQEDIPTHYVSQTVTFEFSFENGETNMSISLLNREDYHYNPHVDTVTLNTEPFDFSRAEKTKKSFF